MEKLSVGRLTPEPLCIGFFDGNFERVFWHGSNLGNTLGIRLQEKVFALGKLEMSGIERRYLLLGVVSAKSSTENESTQVGRC